MRDPKREETGKDGMIYAKCRHAILKVDKPVGSSLDLGTVYDWCPQCTKRITENFDKLQTTFGETFGEARHEDSANPE